MYIVFSDANAMIGINHPNIHRVSDVNAMTGINHPNVHRVSGVF
jgi:hypothetical protein